ncbi:hypothetical protein JKG68_06995 [Microvirga aerilata]|jgi:hypothetical protein|uniref:Uncharacterized protein n=1 Tax=Microvirga aerilata TaxID=670292 RepID=A0A936Z9Y4_9HYPH|nr:hypothetical protein [Microvirga aerilata]MBL0403705.1 hypothetical protein [Microvirga aerilata]
MKLKNYDWDDLERRLGTTDSRLVRDSRSVRAALLALAVFGVAVLAGVAVYLVCLSAPFQDSDPAANALRTWRSL